MTRSIAGVRAACIALLMVVSGSAYAQSGTSVEVSYDFFPYSHLANPGTAPINGERNFEQDVETRVSSLSVGLSIPAQLSKMTLLETRLGYHRQDFDYRGWNDIQGGNPVRNVQAIEVGLALKRQLNYQWNSMLSVTPGLYSDFENDINGKDFNISVVALLIRLHSKTLTYGFGFAYSLEYGEPLPLPVLSATWTNESNMTVEAILPSSIHFWYTANSFIDLGLLAEVGGNRYHGSPDRYKVSNPQVRYSVGTIGPSFRFKLGQNLVLRTESGITFLRRFEFLNGSTEIRDVDLRQSYFLRALLTIGT